jgi:hypothetical protein
MSADCETSSAMLKASRAHTAKITQYEKPLTEGNLASQLTKL